MTKAVPLDIESKLLAAVTELETILRELPRSDRAAKITALIWRLNRDLENGRDIETTVQRLVAATANAVDADPWVRLDRIAQCLPTILNSAHATEATADAAPASETTVGPRTAVAVASTSATAEA
jgi:hypothetical protein